MNKHLTEYENVAIAFYSNDDMEERRLTHEKNSDLTEKIKTSETKTSNPYREAYFWLKGEYMSL